MLPRNNALKSFRQRGPQNIFYQEFAITYAHLPAGYIVGQLLSDKFEQRIKSYPLYWFWGLLGSVTPDFDYLYLYLFDTRTYDHHYYPTHFPIFWAMLLFGSLLWLYSKPKSQNPVFAFMFTLNGFIHMILDSVPNPMYWLAPFSYRGFGVNLLLKKIAPWIVYDYPFWSYSIEALIIVLALNLFLKRGIAGIETAKNLPTRNSGSGQP
jgi:hypothetical protein